MPLKQADSLHIVIHSASELANTQFFTRQDPYAIATILPIQAKEAFARTQCVNGGGSNPIWYEEHDNHLIFEAVQVAGASSILLEVLLPVLLPERTCLSTTSCRRSGTRILLLTRLWGR
jgi:hypothetical protein